MTSKYTKSEFGELTAGGIRNCIRYTMADKNGEDIEITHPDDPANNEEWEALCIKKLEEACADET